MFRGGGKVNSVGTGITSGLADREEYRFGGGPAGMQPNIPQGDVKTILDYIQSGSGTGPSGLRGRIGVSDYIQPSAGYGGQSITDVLGYEPTDKPFQGQPSFRSMNEPSVYTPPKVEETTEEMVQDITARAAEDASMKALEKEKDIDKIDLDDFETDIEEKSKLYEKLLAGPDAKKQSIFKALTAAAPGLLAEDYGTAIKAAGEQLGDVSDIRRKARLLAIQEKIDLEKAETLAKLKTKDATTSQIKNYEYQIALGKSPDEAAKIAFGTGDNVQARESEEDIRYTERKLIKTEGSGFEKANITGYEQAAVESTVYGIPTTPYVSAEPGATPEKSPSNVYFKAIGDIYYDPITRKFEVLVEEEGTTKIKRVKSRDEAFKLAGR
jgi:hypothetical protein